MKVCRIILSELIGFIKAGVEAQVQTLKRVYIVWLDAVWCKEEPADLCEMHTVGFLIAETDTKITLASEYSKYDDKFRYYTTIPRSIIQKMTILEENGSAEET